MSKQPVVLQLAPANLPEPDPEKRENAPQPNAGLYKSLLYQYTQRSSGQPPVYQTFNEGAQHKPQFRSRVWIDGAFYTSPNTFSQRKAAETEVSKVAFVAIMKKKKDEGAKLVREDTVFCKSILIEYAVRMNLEKPSYQTTQPDMSLPLFSSSLVFNGVTYTGEFARSKIEAQRLAARAVILSIIDSESGNIMSEIISSKFKLYDALNKAKSSLNVQVGTTPGEVHTGNDNGIQLIKANEVEVASGANYMPTPSTISEPYPGQPTSLPATHQPPKPETPTAVVTPPVISLAPILETTPLVTSTSAVVTPSILVPPVLEQTTLVGSTSGQKRNRKNKKKAQKKARLEAQLPLDVVPLSQIPPCSVAQ